MAGRFRHLLFGSPLPTARLAGERLNKVRALAAFSPDALSSLAYANQEVYLGLVVAGAAGLVLATPIGAAITLLLVVVTFSYYQTIYGYPSGGGSYAVARGNLGALPGAVAAAALLIGYLLTAAVSLTAAVEAIASAFPALWPLRIELALGLLAIITLLNLRGLQESGTVIAVPVYLFLFTYLPMLAYGVYLAWREGPGVLEAVAPPAVQPVTPLLILHTFSAGCTALTGIEAISNGVPSFRPPEARNAGRTLIVMAALMAVLFMGSVTLIQHFAVIAGPDETILSALADRLLERRSAYLLVQASTMLVLAVAANTSFAGFPRLASVLATDGLLPRQLTGLGDRLVFSNGILLLAGATGVLVVAFRGESHALVPLFAVGVFVAFTLSQTGMVRHWARVKGAGWRGKGLVNGLGALATGAAVLIIGISRFREGAWITIVAIPLLVILFFLIRRHYNRVAEQLSLHGLPPDLHPTPRPRTVVPISGVHRGIVDAVNFARSISDDVTVLYIELEPGKGATVREAWEQWWPDVPLVVAPSPYRSIVGPLLDFLDQTDREHNDGRQAVVVLPEFVTAHPWESLLHNQSAWMLKTAMLYRRRNMGYQRVIIDVPYHLRR